MRNKPVNIFAVNGGGALLNLTYGYDAVGNRLSKSNGGSTITYTYDSMDRMLTATGLGFDWDDCGNMIYKHDGVYAWNNTYDTLNGLTGVQKDGALSTLYIILR